MKRIVFSATLIISALSLNSCSKCTTCEVTISQEGVDESKRYTLEKCGSRKDIKEFKDDVNSAYSAYGEEATISCKDN